MRIRRVIARTGIWRSIQFCPMSCLGMALAENANRDVHMPGAQTHIGERMAAPQEDIVSDFFFKNDRTDQSDSKRNEVTDGALAE
jgi:hypothetical protein